MNKTETQQVLDALKAAKATIAPEHDGNDFESECEECHAYRDATAAIALCEASLAQPRQSYCDGAGNALRPSQAVELSNVVATAPKKIYLVISEDTETSEDFNRLERGESLCWCEDKIDDNSIGYVREDLVAINAKGAAS